MKTLLLLRHAKSSWKDPHLSDHDRPLNKRGKNAAPKMGRLLAAEDLVPQLILCSTAKRARTTAELAAAAAGCEGQIELHEPLYHADADVYLAAAEGASDALDRVMIVGHNPGMEALVANLGGAYERFPTAALAQFEMETESWQDVTRARARLVNLWRPREVD